MASASEIRFNFQQSLKRAEELEEVAEGLKRLAQGDLESELFVGYSAPEQYQEETDKLLMESLGKRQLYGFQIVIIILVLVMMVLIYLPFWMGYGSAGRPEIRPFFLFFWILAGAVAWCGCYINRKFF